MGLTAPELCPAGPSRRSAFTRIQTRVAMHAMCLLPCCGADAEGLSATTFDAACATPHHQTSSYKARNRDKPRHIQHDIRDAKGDGKGSSARLVQPRRLTGERDDTTLSQNMRSKNERFARPQQ